MRTVLLAPVAEVVDADHLVAELLQEVGDEAADDSRAQMARMEGLGDVGRAVLDNDRLAIALRKNAVSQSSGPRASQRTMQELPKSLPLDSTSFTVFFSSSVLLMRKLRNGPPALHSVITSSSGNYRARTMRSKLPRPWQVHVQRRRQRQRPEPGCRPCTPC